MIRAAGIAVNRVSGIAVNRASAVAAFVGAAAVPLGWVGPHPVAAEEPASPSEAVGEAAISVWDGVYTREQAERGAAVYPGPCGRCHGHKLDGAPDDPDMIATQPIGGAKFLRNWDGRSLAALFGYTRATMPENNPSFLSDREYLDLIAYLLSMSDVPAGNQTLTADPDVLSRIVIRRDR